MGNLVAICKKAGSEVGSGAVGHISSCRDDKFQMYACMKQNTHLASKPANHDI